MPYEINPCEKCTIKNGYGGQTRCSYCELTHLREENKNLKNKIKRGKSYGKN